MSLCQPVARLHRRRRRRRGRAYAPTSNTVSYDNHEKIISWVSFCFPYMGCLWGSAWRPFGPPELRYKCKSTCVLSQIFHKCRSITNFSLIRHPKTLRFSRTGTASAILNSLNDRDRVLPVKATRFPGVISGLHVSPLPVKMEKTGKFLWSFSLLIRPEWYPDSCINNCFSDLKRFGITKKFSWGANVEKFLLVKCRAAFQNKWWLRCSLFAKF